MNLIIGFVIYAIGYILTYRLIRNMSRKNQLYNREARNTVLVISIGSWITYFYYKKLYSGDCYTNPEKCKNDEDDKLIKW